MGYYGDITVGDVVDHSARRENDISAALNAFGKTGDPKLTAKGANYNRIPVCNLGSIDLTAGTPVRLTGKADDTGSIFDVEQASDASRPYGILLGDLPKGGTSSTLIDGVVLIDVVLKNKNHEYADPGSAGMESASTGQCRILWRSAETGNARCVVLLSPGGNNHTGPFAVSIKDGKLSVSAGFLNCNGSNYQSVPATDGIPPSSGYLCVCCSPNLKGGWTKPEVKIAQPGFEAYPVAEITVKDGAISIRQYPVAVAVVMVSKPCPLARLP